MRRWGTSWLAAAAGVAWAGGGNLIDGTAVATVLVAEAAGGKLLSLYSAVAGRGLN